MTPADEPTGPRGGPVGSHARLGRRIALGLYAIAVVYVVVAAFVSIPPQIFASGTPDSSLRCEAEARALEDTLLDALADAVDPRRKGALPDGAFWASWDGRLRAARASCPGTAVHLGELRQLRYRVEDSVARHERSAGSLARRLHRALAPAPRGPTGVGPHLP